MKQKSILRSVLAAVLTLVATTASALSFVVDGINYNTTGGLDYVNRRETVEVISNNYSGSVVIPSSVTYSGRTYSVTSIGVAAFSGCI